MAVRLLRRGHGFALVDVHAVYHLSVAVNDVVSARPGAGIAAIKLHIRYLRKYSMCNILRHIRTVCGWHTRILLTARYLCPIMKICSCRRFLHGKYFKEMRIEILFALRQGSRRWGICVPQLRLQDRAERQRRIAVAAEYRRIRACLHNTAYRADCQHSSAQQRQRRRRRKERRVCKGGHCGFGNFYCNIRAVDFRQHSCVYRGFHSYIPHDGALTAKMSAWTHE